MTSRYEQQPNPQREVTPSIPHSEGLKRALTLAWEEAEKQKHHYLSTGHLLLGISQEEASKRVLDGLGIKTEAIRSNMATIVQTGKEPVNAKYIKQSERTKRAIRLAATEAIQSHAKEVTPTHAVIGILLEGKGVAVQIIEKLSGKNRNGLLTELRTTS